jgi:hypothetical protein
METLIKISRYTGEKKYLEPIPRALEYFKKCLLPDGRMARYYEVQTNRPLYMDARYQLSYDDNAVPSHYGWKQPARLESIASAYEDVKQNRSNTAQASLAELERRVRTIIRELDAAGRWVSSYKGERLVGRPEFRESFPFISSALFSRNIETLSEYIARNHADRFRQRLFFRETALQKLSHRGPEDAGHEEDSGRCTASHGTLCRGKRSDRPVIGTVQDGRLSASSIAVVHGTGCQSN